MKLVRFKDVSDFKFRINPEERQGAYGLYFIRPFSVFLTYVALRLGASANQVTVAQIVLGIVGPICLALGGDSLAIIGLVILQLGFVLDNVDGEVARFRGQVSLTGKYLDTVGHEIVIPLLYFTLGLNVFFRLGTIESVVFGFLAGLFSLRLDVLTMTHEAAQLIQSGLNKSFAYYPQFAGGEVPKLYRQKNEGSIKRVVYGIFAYPAIMNIIAILFVIDLFFPLTALSEMNRGLCYFFLMMYGILLPIRRLYTIARIVKSRSTERTYLDIQRSVDRPDS